MFSCILHIITLSDLGFFYIFPPFLLLKIGKNAFTVVMVWYFIDDHKFFNKCYCYWLKSNLLSVIVYRSHIYGFLRRSCLNVERKNYVTNVNNTKFYDNRSEPIWRQLATQIHCLQHNSLENRKRYSHK